MGDQPLTEYKVSVNQLRPGVFVRLEKTDWFSHPFLFSSFKVKEQQQVEALKLLGIEEVVCVPDKSDEQPLPQEDACKILGGDDSAEAMERLWQIKKARIAQLQEKRDLIARCEQRFAESVRSLHAVRRSMLAAEPGAVDDALALVRRLAKYFLGDTESVLHLMNVVPPTDQMYSHGLNVSILSMMLAAQVGFGSEEMEALGLGALFHDIGKERLDKKLLKKRGELSRVERESLKRHVHLGLEIMAERPEHPGGALSVVAQHHENMDGSGYPVGVGGEDIDRLARMASIANVYDNLCNHSDPEQSQTPYLALSYMFSQLKTRFDVELLARFIRCLGVYPPGTVVQLNNGSVGMVMSVNPEHQLRPSLLLYDPEIPKREALIVDLQESEELSIEKSLNPRQLPAEIGNYLNPRSRITYYVDPDG